MSTLIEVLLIVGLFLFKVTAYYLLGAILFGIPLAFLSWKIITKDQAGKGEVTCLNFGEKVLRILLFPFGGGWDDDQMSWVFSAGVYDKWFLSEYGHIDLDDISIDSQKSYIVKSAVWWPLRIPVSLTFGTLFLIVSIIWLVMKSIVNTAVDSLNADKNSDESSSKTDSTETSPES